MSDMITTVDELRQVIAKPIAMIETKEIDFLDEGARAWISKTPLAVFGFGDEQGIAITLGGGCLGFVSTDVHELRLPSAMLDDPSAARQGAGFGAIFLLPGITEILRVNGKVVEILDDEIRVAVEECYTHCGKALLRSEFWSPPADIVAPDDLAAFALASRFMALATMSAQGHADVSPKGDKAGTMVNIDGEDLWFADRPGNRRADSFRNIITQPRVAAMLLIPGTANVACLSGTAQITTNEAIRSQFAVQDKVPALATRIRDLSVELRHSPALARADLWPVSAPTEGINPTKIGIAHLKYKKGVGVKLVAAMASIPGLMDKALKDDYKKNLF
ncbi:MULTISPECIES: pyridoxamine 5'-phosphate oxidase family protein [unclassified Sphingomonas]|uniref:pyridoxamine 5'-phosphate oxidase family protein n=1 Tax=unclassified Sphingomonas TaxID=196159 RepID=UPI0006F3F792|nr:MULTISPECIES: pyridoxamine 5'-phosphate oxidase family protein [unclassified Sphingomonas]KQX18609.1 pyridoxamine 5-phosphate oxidase [Sphingomonas sp. Root1294]KQY72068.1 pyridoxamine 5-phosphate oxidase [Sphingomonas sp. Root50]KRB94663.1 pyridoxamine 5-phosphate oxidase [Sphingomonas sp. Root720]